VFLKGRSFIFLLVSRWPVSWVTLHLLPHLEPQLHNISMEARRAQRPEYDNLIKPRTRHLDKPGSKQHEQLPPSKRRRLAPNGKPLIDLTGDADDVAITKVRKKNPAPVSSTGERRARRFRTHPPLSYLEKLDRARTQK
jgi:hypothetical protein